MLKQYCRRFRGHAVVATSEVWQL